jgi:hypothetical protein
VSGQFNTDAYTNSSDTNHFYRYGYQLLAHLDPHHTGHHGHHH